MKKKKDRLVAIREIVMREKIGSQDELLSLLEAQGFELTQATLSRDLKQLQIAKVADNKGAYVYILPEMGGVGKLAHPRIQAVTTTAGFAAAGFISIEFSHHLAVIRTRPGYASSIAYDIDVNSPHEILGTIAGDDTILIIPREEYTRTQVLRALQAFIPNIDAK
jgi:transcriptional regulator of arginine metabolism